MYHYGYDNVNDEFVSAAPHFESLPEQWQQSQFSDYIEHIKIDYGLSSKSYLYSQHPSFKPTHCEVTTAAESVINPYPTAFPYGNGMVLHFYQQQESSTTKTVHRVINKGLKAYV